MTRINPRRIQQDNNFARYGEPCSLDQLFYHIVLVSNANQPVLTGLAVSLRRSECVPNSHSCPIDGSMNFNGDPLMVRGYPGWNGRLWLRLEDNTKDFSSTSWCWRTNTHTGSGGFGSYNGPWKDIRQLRHQHGQRHPYPEPICYSWDYRIYEQDWPRVAQWWQHMKTVSQLHHNCEPDSNYYFAWENPAIAERDRRYMQELSTAESNCDETYHI